MRRRSRRGRFQFAFTIMFHYLFPILTMGLGVLICGAEDAGAVAGKGARRIYGDAARFWARIFALTFGMGVVTGIPMEFQFGTNWARFSHYAGRRRRADAVHGGRVRLLRGIVVPRRVPARREARVARRSTGSRRSMVGGGAVLSGYFIVATNAWMQNPVGYGIVDGRAQLDVAVGAAHESLSALAVSARHLGRAASPGRW